MIVFVLYWFYIPRINIGLNRVFIQLIVVEMIVMISDIVSSVTDENYFMYPDWQLYVINDLYFAFFFARAYLFYLLTMYLLKLHRNLMELLHWGMIIPFVTAIILTITSNWTHFVYYITDDGYQKGSVYDYVVYSCLLFYEVISFAVLVIYRKNMPNITRLLGAMGFNFTILTGTVVRWMFPRYLLLDTFCLIAIIIIYLSFTNPDFYYDSKTDVFNSEALTYYVDEIRSFRYKRYIAVGLHNYKELREVYGASSMDKGLKLIGSYFRNKYKNLIPFYSKEGRFVLIGNRDIEADKIIDQINQRFKESWNFKDTKMYFELDFVMTDENMTIESPERRLEVGMDILADDIELVPGNVRYVEDADVERVEREVYIRKTLKWVIEHETAEVYLQPIVRADNHQIIGAEALARIRDKDGNRIMPGEFIRVAEQNGAINQMGEQIFKKTCEYIKDNDLEKMGISWINVNLSPTQFMNNSLAFKYNSIIEKSGIDVGLIHLEITEDAMVDQMVLLRQIQAMKERGFRFVLDDYGKGYSNLDRLKDIPFINIKLDMAIVRDYCNKPDGLLPSLVQTFKTVGFTVTAEGIETKEMADEMYKIGCDFLQGYLFSPPVPIEEFKDYCARQ